jgi:hypothetical protein
MINCAAIARNQRQFGLIDWVFPLNPRRSVAEKE